MGFFMPPGRSQRKERTVTIKDYTDRLILTGQIEGPEPTRLSSFDHVLAPVLLAIATGFLAGLWVGLSLGGF